MLSNGSSTLAAQLSRIIELLSLGSIEGQGASEVARTVELLTRLRSLHQEARPQTPERVVIGPLLVDFAGHDVWVDGRRLHLTHREFGLLSYLVSNHGRVCKREDIVGQVWGNEALVSSRTIDIHVYRLRNKLAPHTELIETIRNVGYILRAPATQDAPVYSE